MAVHPLPDRMRILWGRGATCLAPRNMHSLTRAVILTTSCLAPPLYSPSPHWPGSSSKRDVRRDPVCGAHLMGFMSGRLGLDTAFTNFSAS